MKIPAILHKQNVAQAAIVITILVFVSKLVGFARDVLVAKFFGTTGITDAFIVALTIPALILGLFSRNLGTLIIPVYIEKKTADPAAARKFVNDIFIVSTIIFLFISLLVVFFAPICVKAVAFGFKGERLAAAIPLTRYLAISGLFTVLTGFLTGLLQSEKQFLAPALAMLAGNAVLLLSLFFLTGRLGVNSWTVGQNALAIVNFGLLFFLLWKKYGFFRKCLQFRPDWTELFRFGKLFVPLMAVSGMSFLNTIIDKAIGSKLEAGSIATITFAARIWGTPVTLLAVPIATAVFPRFSELAVAEERSRKEFSAKIGQTLGISWFFVIPSTIFLLFMSEPVVRLFFERGAFDPSATALTADVVRLYAIGIFAHAAIPILGRVFYSLKNTVTPMLISLGCLSLNIVLNLILARLMGVPGIALSTSIVMILNVALFSICLKKRIPVITRPLAVESFKLVLASLPLAAVCLLVQPFFAGKESATLIGFSDLLLRTGLTVLVAGGAFLAACHLLKIPSYFFARDFIVKATSRLLKRREA